MSTPFDLATTRRIHLVGIGGAGMSGIARVLLSSGHDVRGTDLHDSRSVEGLRALGARVEIGHSAAAVRDAEVVVISTAVPASNPEVLHARETGVPILRRAEMLAALMAGQRQVLVAGTHGKTTTTSMAVVAMHAAGLDPSYAIGGTLNETGSNAHGGSADIFVAEADESDKSFLVFAPDIAVVTNAELDHPDSYASEREVHDTFVSFLALLPANGTAILCADDEGSARLAETTNAKVVMYGAAPTADVRLVTSPTETKVVMPDGLSVPLHVGVPGQHNLLNATAAMAICHVLGISVADAAAGMTNFQGAQRRFQRLGQAGGVDVIDDYAHHPTELRATLAAARSVADGRIVVVVQPHRYSRTAMFGADLGRAAAAADVVVVTEVYGSSEPAVPGVSGTLVADAARAAGANVIWQPHLASIVDDLLAVVEEGDTVVITGAGDVTRVGPELLRALSERAGG